MSQTMKKLQPFGDVPKKLTEQLRRSFVASRTFAQALLEGKQIVNKISKVRKKLPFMKNDQTLGLSTPLLTLTV